MADREMEQDALVVEPLTRRERQVLALLAEGYSGPEIAEKFTIALSSVKFHIQNIYGKLGANSKRQAITRASELGLLGAAAPAELLTLAEAAEAAPEPGQPPFMGLRFFDEADAPLFFGREALVARLAARLTGRAAGARELPPHFLAIVGASGSGKSSIVRAGLVPALRASAGASPAFDPIHVLTPTAHPLEALATSLTAEAESVTATATLMDDLARDERALHLHLGRLDAARDLGRNGHAGGRPLLVVDQFEELFTLCRGEAERRAFIGNLIQAAAPDSETPATVVITLRADFYSACAAYPELRELLARQQEYIGSMSADELRQAIERPAALGHWTFATGLVDLILKDVGGEPGALPLLSHALLESWERRRGRMLTLESYAEAGRVQGAIATTAESVLQSLAPSEQELARGVFLRLTELGEGTQDTRRRVALVELLPPSENGAAAGSPMAIVLKTLSDARLITVDGAVVQVAHEALIREWPTLRGWLTEDREGLRLHRRLTEAAQEWDALKREPSELYRGPRLVQALDWAAAHASDLNPLERQFVAASQALAEREAAEREAQRQHELEVARGLAEAQRQRAEAETRRALEQTQAAARLRRRNRVITAIGALALLAALAAGFFGLQSNRSTAAAQAASTQAIAQRDESQRQAQLAFANQLAGQAIIAEDRDYSLALLLGGEAYRINKSQQARASLLIIFKASPRLLTIQRSHVDWVTGVAYSPDGKLLATAEKNGSIGLWDTATGQPAGAPISVTFSSEPVMAFSPDGKLLVVGVQDGSLLLFDVATRQTHGQPLAGYATPISSVAFGPDGQTLAASSDMTWSLWDVATGQSLGGPFTGHTDRVSAVAFSPDGKTLASGSGDGTLRLWDVASGQPQGEPFTGHLDGVTSLAYSPDGKLLVSGSWDRDVLLWDATGASRAPLARLKGHAAGVTGVAFSPDGALVASASEDRTVWLWDVATRAPLGQPLVGHTAQVTSVAFSPNGRRLASGGADRTVVFWQVAEDLTSMAAQDWPTRACAMATRNLTPAEWDEFLPGRTYHQTCDQWPAGQ